MHHHRALVCATLLTAFSAAAQAQTLIDTSAVPPVLSATGTAGVTAIDVTIGSGGYFRTAGTGGATGVEGLTLA